MNLPNWAIFLKCLLCTQHTSNLVQSVHKIDLKSLILNFDTFKRCLILREFDKFGKLGKFT